MPRNGDAPGAPALQVEGLTKRYEGTIAVRGLTFDVKRGEVLGLVGPNGAGKTTTLRTIAGILPVQEGRVVVGGFDLTRDEVRAKQRLAWVPDDPQPFDTLTVFEHLEFTAALYNVPRWKERAEALLTRFELGEKRNALGGELSRGMRQKLSFCCAWLHSPDLVLLDEPLTGLDPRGIRAGKQAIADLARDGTAVILSSHLLELVERMAHRILILDRGERIFLGTIEEARATIAPSGGGDLEAIFLAATERGGGSGGAAGGGAAPATTVPEAEEPPPRAATP